MGADLDRIAVFDPKEFIGRPLVLPHDLDIIENAISKVRAKDSLRNNLNNWHGLCSLPVV
jgi:hypothetical protein